MKNDAQKHIAKQKAAHDTYFAVRIDGMLYGLWRDMPSSWGALPMQDTWWWEPVQEGNIDINTAMSAAAHQKIVSLTSLLNRTTDYAGLTPQQFVNMVIKGM